MKSFTISLVLLFMPINFTQENLIKQITNYEFDSRNPVILSPDSPGELFFEEVNDSAVNIFSLKYDPEVDTFFQLTQITSNNFINRNLVASYINNKYPLTDYKIILWETNQRGNWDIAFSIDSGNGWTNPELLLSSTEDETQPSCTQQPYSFSFNESLEFTYTKGNSVYLFKKDSAASEKILFEGNDTVQYSNSVYSNQWDYIAAAERRINEGDPYIVYRQKIYKDSAWSEIIEVYNQMPAENPKFIDVKLFFEKLFNGKRKVMWSYLNQIEDSGFTYELLDDQILETSDFFTFNMPVLVKINDYHSLDPYCFRYVKNDSAFIRSSINNERVLETFTNIYTKVFHSHPTIGSMYHDYAENEVISYTIWEDSADGKINLLGLKNKNPILGVKKEQTLKGFSLSQNYPNPFNPITKIRYAVRTRRFVTLAVYDLLGRQVAALVNEEKLPGVYEVEFNANGLASGIYFYQLKAGSFVQTKKLILLK